MLLPGLVDAHVQLSGDVFRAGRGAIDGDAGRVQVAAGPNLPMRLFNHHREYAAPAVRIRIPHHPWFRTVLRLRAEASGSRWSPRLPETPETWFGGALDDRSMRTPGPPPRTATNSRPELAVVCHREVPSATTPGRLRPGQRSPRKSGHDSAKLKQPHDAATRNGHVGDVADVAAELNSRPRRTLDGLTPAAALADYSRPRPPLRRPPETAIGLRDDALVVRPTFDATRAISIKAPTEQVWPWLMQVGFFLLHDNKIQGMLRTTTETRWQLDNLWMGMDLRVSVRENVDPTSRPEDTRVTPYRGPLTETGGRRVARSKDGGSAWTVSAHIDCR
jgi:hypothetical protein